LYYRPNLFVAYLRRPYNLDDLRKDPYYLVGSFGTTGCHDTNLLNPRIYQHLRSFSHPAKHPDPVISLFEEWCARLDDSAFATIDRETLDPYDR